MDLGLKGKTAFVSGSTAGIGYAIAQLLAAEGANMVVFLCSERASATNGAAVRTDGGIIRSIV